MMAVPRAFARLLLLPLQERLRGRPTMRLLRWMRRNDRLPPHELQALHDRLLVAHLKRAAERVAWYRERVDPGAIRSPADLERFPVLERADVLEAGERLVADGALARVFAMTTGGSSGEPLRYFTDPLREASQLACKHRARAWWGLVPGYRETHLWGSPIEGERRGGLRGLAGRLLGYQHLSAFNLDDATMATFRTHLEGGRCDLVYGYPSVLAHYAHWLRERGEDLAGLPIQLVVCTAETLLERDRELIADVFQAPVANEYGCRDGGLVAHESRSGMHLMHDAVHVEILDSGGSPVPDGDVGEVVLTNLHAGAAPLIRYRVGDLASRDPAPPRAGNPHPRLLRIEGRTTDLLYAADGSRVHGLAVIYVLRELPGVRRFRCIQEAVGHVRVELVPAPDFPGTSVEQAITSGIRRELGATTEVELVLLEHLPPHPSGKHRHVICTVAE